MSIDIPIDISLGLSATVWIDVQLHLVADLVYLLSHVAQNKFLYVGHSLGLAVTFGTQRQSSFLTSRGWLTRPAWISRRLCTGRLPVSFWIYLATLLHDHYLSLHLDKRAAPPACQWPRYISDFHRPQILL